MNTIYYRISIVFTAIFIIAGCSAAKLEGLPEETGLLILDGSTVGDSIFQAVQLAGEGEGSPIIKGQITQILSTNNEIFSGDSDSWRGYVIFSNLKPGPYRIVRVGDHPYLPAGFKLPESDEFAFKIEAGKPKYLGFLKVRKFSGKKSAEEKKKKRFKVDYSSEREKKTWEHFIKVYADSPWAEKMKARVADLR